MLVVFEIVEIFEFLMFVWGGLFCVSWFDMVVEVKSWCKKYFYWMISYHSTKVCLVSMNWWLVWSLSYFRICLWRGVYIFLCDHRMWCIAMHTIDDCEGSNCARLAVFMWNSALVMVWRNVVRAAYQRSTIPFKWDPIVIGDVRRRLAVLWGWWYA